MEKEKSAITEQIINLTLEILYLLTGEDYIIVKKPGGQTTHNRLQVVEGICRTLGNVFLTPFHSMTPQEDKEQKILELTNKMIELLTGEVPIRCQDVAVYFSMEEWEYIEGHKDLYDEIMKEKHQNIVLPDATICKNSLLHNVTSVLVNDDDMDIESGTESSEIYHSQEIQKISSGTDTENTSGYENWTISDVDHTQYSSVRIKEEPCDISWDEEPLTNTTIPSAVQFHSLHIKEEPVSDDEDLTNANMYRTTGHTHHTYPYIMEKPVLHVEQNLTHPNIYPSTSPSPYLSSPIMEEPSSSNKVNLGDTNLNRQFLPICIKEEPVSFEEPKDTKTCRYPKQQSTSVKQREPGSRHGRKRKILKNTLKEPRVALPLPEHPETDGDNENISSSVYSVRQSDNTMEILYHCPSCHKGFFSNLDLARHQVIHTVDKLFICSLCGKSFTELSFLVKHQVIHTDLKLCVCSVCGGCFYSETSLAKHQKSHSLPVYCFTCGRCFFDKTELEVHKRKHTGERPYACHLCGKHFIAKSVLKKHMLTHTQAEHCK